MDQKEILYREKARMIAVSELYSLDFNGRLDEPVDLEVFEGMTEEEMASLDEETLLMARYLIKGTLDSREEIDALISEYSINRPIERINIVDRNVLRISIFQLNALKDTHPNIIIDQAVKLSQSLSNDVSYKFINGILDKIVKDKYSDSDKK